MLEKKKKKRGKYILKEARIKIKKEKKLKSWILVRCTVCHKNNDVNKMA